MAEPDGGSDKAVLIIMGGEQSLLPGIKKEMENEKMSTYNDIGIDSRLDWKRIAKLFRIGLFAGILVLIGDMLLGWGVPDESLADNTLEAYYKTITLPFFCGYITLMVPSLCTIIAVLSGYLDVPKWCALLNSIVFLIIGVTLRKIKKEWFYDLPGIIMPSLGLSMIGLIGIINLL